MLSAIGKRLVSPRCLPGGLSLFYTPEHSEQDRLMKKLYRDTLKRHNVSDLNKQSFMDRLMITQLKYPSLVKLVEADCPAHKRPRLTIPQRAVIYERSVTISTCIRKLLN